MTGLKEGMKRPAVSVFIFLAPVFTRVLTLVKLVFPRIVFYLTSAFLVFDLFLIS